MSQILQVMMTITNPPKLAINGILLLNKPLGMTSNAVLQKAKRLFNAKKAGHTGSLDPLATGMLPICFGEATKICQYQLDADKCYQTTGILGIKTNTADAGGEVIASIEQFSISESELLHVMSKYLGNTQQVPSMFSALKHNGTPLYRYARQGIEIERKARDIFISQLQLEQFDGKQFSLTVCCGKGTYIRNLVEDIGDALGVGAHVSHLHRCYTAGFEYHTMYTLDELEQMSVNERLNCLNPMDLAVRHLDTLILSDAEVLLIRQGRKLFKTKNSIGAERVRLYDEHSEFIGLGELQEDGELKAKRLLSFDSIKYT